MKETVGRSIGMLSNLIRRHFSTFSFHDTLSPAQGKTLHFILARSMDTDVFQKDVEEEYSLRPPTATKILKDMEKNGLIRRETVPYDARLKRIVVTEKGLQYQEMIRESLEAEDLSERRKSVMRTKGGKIQPVLQGYGLAVPNLLNFYHNKS